MNGSKTRFISHLRQKGLSATRPRLEILKAVRGIPGHFDVESLIFRLRRKGSRISRGTVYRTVPLLVGAQLLRPVAFTDRHAHYEVVAGSRHHDHLICLRCGRVIEFYRESLEREMKEVCLGHGFRPLAHKMEVTGLCSQCARRRMK
jgi:Fur family ferric uptake transcriptional regulator